MKELIFYFESMNSSGGIERVIATLCNKLSTKYSISILVKDDPVSFYSLNKSIKLYSIENYFVHNMNNRASRIFNILKKTYKTVLKLKSKLNNNQFDYIYIAHPLNVLEYYLTGLDMKKVVISEHASKIHYNFIYKLIKKLLYKKCYKYIIPTTIDTKDYIDENLPAIYIPHFKSELNYFKSTLENQTVLNIGRFTLDKQQLVLLEIWNSIMKGNDCIGWKLIIIGSGELESQLKNYINNNNLSYCTEILPPSKNIEEFYLNSSIFALTSRSEGFGMVLLEAISFGIPTLSFNCLSGPRDIIEDEKNGYLIELNNKIEYKNKLEKLMKSPIRLIEMGQNAFESSQKWTDERIIKKWIKVFN